MANCEQFALFLVERQVSSPELIATIFEFEFAFSNILVVDLHVSGRRMMLVGYWPLFSVRLVGHLSVLRKVSPHFHQLQGERSIQIGEQLVRSKRLVGYIPEKFV